MQLPDREKAVGIYLRVTYAGGMTLRMAAEIVKALQPFDVAVSFVHHGFVASARNALEIASMGAVYGDKVYLWAEGPDASLAVQAVMQAFAGNFETEPAAA